MTRVAKRPLDNGATQAANASAAEAYPITPAPGDPEYGAFQKTWMDSYLANGGEAQEKSPSDTAQEAQTARTQTQGNTGTAEVCEACEAKKATTTAPPDPEEAANANAANDGSSASAPAPSLPPVPTNVPVRKVKPKPKPCTCRMAALKVTCSHGRAAKNGLLQIVASSTLAGDDVTIDPAATGGDCSSKLKVTMNGFKGSEPTTAKGAGAQKRATHSPGPVRDTFAWPHIAPRRATAEANACGGNSKLVTVERFPAGKSQLQLDVSSVIKAFSGGFGSLPVDERAFTKKGTMRKRARKGEGKKSTFATRWDNRDKGWDDSKVGVQIGCEWKEDETNHLAYCEVFIWGGWDPVFGYSFSMLVYGVPIPGKLKDYIKAGIYLNFSGKVTFGVRGKIRRYPALADKYQQPSLSAELSGSLKIELAAELFVLSPKVCQAKAAGAVGANLKGTGELDSNADVWLNWELTVGELTAGVTVKLWWGLWETEREWPLFEGFKTGDKNKITSLA